MSIYAGEPTRSLDYTYQADEINRVVGVDARQKVTCGEAVVAMILNALGFVDRPLYLFPEFMVTKPEEILIRGGLKAEDFNDDVLGFR